MPGVGADRLEGRGRAAGHTPVARAQHLAGQSLGRLGLRILAARGRVRGDAGRARLLRADAARPVARRPGGLRPHPAGAEHPADVRRSPDRGRAAPRLSVALRPGRRHEGARRLREPPGFRALGPYGGRPDADLARRRERDDRRQRRTDPAELPPQRHLAGSSRHGHHCTGAQRPERSRRTLVQTAHPGGGPALRRHLAGHARRSPGEHPAATGRGGRRGRAGPCLSRHARRAQLGRLDRAAAHRSPARRHRPRQLRRRGEGAAPSGARRDARNGGRAHVSTRVRPLLPRHQAAARRGQRVPEVPAAGAGLGRDGSLPGAVAERPRRGEPASRQHGDGP
ncbi:hypothetical protein P376_3827 [Streptomyces sp. HCCB10043]|nr:hypothetical protein P376_3827 [Streptomyces sp. HCCB10043]